jgi:Uncharacterised protein family (UPF0182)
MRWRGIAVTVVVIVACLFALGLASNVLVDWLWFSAVGYRDVFWTIFGAKALLFFAVFLGSGRLPLGVRNAGLAVRSTARALASRSPRPGIRDRPDLAQYVARAVRARVPAASVAVAHRGGRRRPRDTHCRDSPGGVETDRARDALSRYDRAIERLKSFGAELDALRPLLEELSQYPSGR